MSPDYNPSRMYAPETDNRFKESRMDSYGYSPESSSNHRVEDYEATPSGSPYSSNYGKSSDERRLDEYNQDRRNENEPIQSELEYNQPKYYKSTNNESNRYELPSNYNYSETQDYSESSTSNTSDRNGSQHHSAYIDENNQEVTFDEAREPGYYDEAARPPEVLDTIREPSHETAPETRTPVYEPPIVPEQAYTVEYDSHPNDNRLIYQPDSSNAGSPNEVSTNSYEKRMSQIDEYWREEKRRRQMYESQNTYRHPIEEERQDRLNRECTYDPIERKLRN